MAADGRTYTDVSGVLARKARSQTAVWVKQ